MDPALFFLIFWIAVGIYGVVGLVRDWRATRPVRWVPHEPVNPEDVSKN